MFNEFVSVSFHQSVLHFIRAEGLPCTQESREKRMGLLYTSLKYALDSVIEFYDVELDLCDESVSTVLEHYEYLKKEYPALQKAENAVNGFVAYKNQQNSDINVSGISAGMHTMLKALWEMYEERVIVNAEAVSRGVACFRDVEAFTNRLERFLYYSKDKPEDAITSDRIYESYKQYLSAIAYIYGLDRVTQLAYNSLYEDFEYVEFFYPELVAPIGICYFIEKEEEVPSYIKLKFIYKSFREACTLFQKKFSDLL